MENVQANTETICCFLLLVNQSFIPGVSITLTNMHSDLRSNPSSRLCNNSYMDELFRILGCNQSPLVRFRTMKATHACRGMLLMHHTTV